MSDALEPPRIAEPAPPPILPAAPPPIPRPERPRIWPSLVALLVAPIAMTVATLLVLLPAMALTTGISERTDFAKQLSSWTASHGATLFGMLVLLVPGEIGILATAWLPALASRDPRRRLGLVRWRVPGGTVALAVVGTLFVQVVGTFLAGLWSQEPSQALKDLWALLAEPRGALAVVVIILASVLPGLCEELLFRGYVQTRLLQRWSPFAAIALASVAFTIMHADVQHMIGVLPLGIWFGFVAWKTGSVWASILCHFVNNATAIVAGRLLGDEMGDIPYGPPYYAVVLVLFVVWILAVVSLSQRRWGRDASSAFRH